MGYDDVIPLLGDFGRYQRRICLLLFLPSILCGFHKLGNVFLIAEPDYRCQLATEHPNATYDSIAKADFGKYYPWDQLKKQYSHCEMYDVYNKPRSCDAFIYDHHVYGYTTVIEWELTCNKSYLIATSNALFMCGVMLGALIFGELSDRLGRKPIFFISLVLQVAAGLVAAVAPDFWTFTIARAVVGATTSGVYLVAYVIGLEMVGPSKRLLAGTLCPMFFSFGYILTTVFALYIYDWRYLQLALTLPGLIFFTYWWFIPESTRWLLNKHRVEEAKDLIKSAAHENKVVITDEQLDKLLSEEMRTEHEPVKKVTILEVFKFPNLRKRTLVIFLDWFASNITYYGLSWNTNNLGGNPYVNFVISGAVEFPAYAIMLLTLNRYGRKFVLCACMITAGSALLLSVLIPDDYQWLTITLAMLGKLCITASYGIIYIVSSEQFPTVIRNVALGTCSTFARTGSIVCPYINALDKIWGPLPLLIFGTFSLTGGLLSLSLPETLGKKLPETIEEGEHFGKQCEKEVFANPEEIVQLKIDDESNEQKCQNS